MTDFKVSIFVTTFCLLLTGALTATRADDKPAKVPTSHYVDFAKHIEMDIPLTWERKFSEDEAMRFVFTTGGKATAGAQPPEFTIMITGPDAKDESLKSAVNLAGAAKKRMADVKFDKEKELKVDGESALSFTGSGKTKTGTAKLLDVVTIHNGMGYAVSFACDPATFDSEVKGAQPVIDSIKWMK